MKDFNFEHPLTRLIWISSLLCIVTSFGMSWLLLRDLTADGDFRGQLWWQLAATVVGDTVGDPFKDTCSVALNPIIKFSTLFGLLVVEIAVKIKEASALEGSTAYYHTAAVGLVMLAIALVFVWRSFYAMRIPQEGLKQTAAVREMPQVLTAEPVLNGQAVSREPEVTLRA